MLFCARMWMLPLAVKLTSLWMKLENIYLGKLLKKSQQPLQHEVKFLTPVLSSSCISTWNAVGWKNWSQNDNVDIFTSISSATATTAFAACVLCWKSHFSLSFLVGFSGNYNHCICCLQFRHSCYVKHPCGSVSWKNLFYFTIMLVVMCSKLFGYHGFALSQFRFYKFKLCLWSSNADWINFHQYNKTGKWAHHSSRDLQSEDA